MPLRCLPCGLVFVSATGVTSLGAVTVTPVVAAAFVLDVP